MGMSVQPQNEQGNIIATCEFKGLLKIFDIRRSTTGQQYFFFFFNIFQFLVYFIKITDAVITAPRRPGLLYSVDFSPTDESLVAVAGNEIGTELIDLRNPQL